MKLNLSLFFFWILAQLFCATSIGAQQMDSLIANNKAIQQSIQDVETARVIYEQSFDFDEKQPWKVVFTLTETNTKSDRSTTHEYFFNLGDLDKNSIKIKSSKQDQEVELNTRRNNDFVKHVEDGEQQSYEDELTIWGQDIDNARAIKMAIEASILPARKAWEAANKTDGSAEELKAWITKQVGPVQLEDEEIQQSLQFDDRYPDRIQFDLSQENSRGDEEQLSYRLSLGDLDAKKIELDIDGSDISIELSTTRSKSFIEVFEEGRLAALEDEFQIYASSIDQGRQMINALEVLIEEGQKELKSRTPEWTSYDEALKALEDGVQAFETAELRVIQQIEGKAIATYSLQTSEIDDDDEESHIYRFAYADLDKKDVDIETSKSAIELAISTDDNKRYIEHEEDGEQENFISSIDIPVPSIENARFLKSAFEYVIAEASQMEQSVEDFNWLVEAVKDGSNESIQQSLTLQEGEDSECKLVFTRLTEEKKGDEEEVFEFNVYDLNGKRIKIDISGKNVGIELVTKDGDDIIKYYEDGEPGFTDDFTIRFSNLQAGKTAQATLKAMWEGCKPE
jgi:hypothetical protein